MPNPRQPLPCLRSTRRGVVLEVHAVPGAAQTAISGLHDNALKVRISAPPAAGAANRELLRYLSTLLSVPPRELEIVRGGAGRRKTVLISEARLEDLLAILSEPIGSWLSS